MRMPEVDQAVLDRRERIASALRTIVPGEGVIALERELRPYESDGLTAYRQLPMVVVLPETIGGKGAEKSGGVHCLKYGVTTNNVLGCEIVLMNGEVLRFGGKHLDASGYDLLGLINGSEGLLGVVTEVTVRILRKPETA